jgi:hypothetical protein
MGMDFASGRWPCVIGAVDRRDYLKARHMAYGLPHFAAMDYMNQNLPADSKVLFLGEAQGYYCDRDHVAATIFDYNPFWVAARQAVDSEDLLARVRKMGITHIFVSAIALYAYASQDNVLPRDVIDRHIFGEFWERYLEKVSEIRQRDPDGRTNAWLFVFKLRNAPVSQGLTLAENVPRNVLADVRRANR